MALESGTVQDVNMMNGWTKKRRGRLREGKRTGLGREIFVTTDIGKITEEGDYKG